MLAISTASTPFAQALATGRQTRTYEPPVDTESSVVGRMHPFSSLTIGIFVAGYITARWDLVTRLYELAIFAWDHGVVVSPTYTSRL
jgi:hypothetical protein